MTKWFRGAELDRDSRGCDDFDPIDEGTRYRLSAAVSSEIWKRVRKVSTDSYSGLFDEEGARRHFHVVAARVAQRPGRRIRPAPTKLTRAEREQLRRTDPFWDVFADAYPGKGARSAAMGGRWEADLSAEKDIPSRKVVPVGTEADALADGETAPASAAAHGAHVGCTDAGPGPGADTAAAPEIRDAVDASDPGVLLGSLVQAPASSLLTALASVQAAMPHAFQSMRAQAQAEMPKIPTPTGLPARPDARAPREQPLEGTTTSLPQPAVHPAPTAPAQRTPGELVPDAPATPPPSPTDLAGDDDRAHGQGPDQMANNPALAQSAQSALFGIRLGANQIPTTATEVPSVEMRGEADPAQLDTALATAQNETTAAVLDARRAATQDRGEHDIFPEAKPEVLEAELAAGKGDTVPGERGAARLAAPDALSAEARASIDADASPILHAKIDAEHQRYTAGKAQQDAAKRAAHEQTRADIAQVEADAHSRQTEAQAAAHGEATTTRADWQHEIDRVDSDFRTQAKTAREQHRQGIVNEQQTANRKAAEHIQNAEKEAAQEKRKAEAEAQTRKDEGKKESGGFFGWLKSKAKALVDGIKSAVNVIYDNLRKAVKAIFEAAKKLAFAVIEVSRRAIAALIKAYGEILKGLVKVALAAFPQLRDQSLHRIDQAVRRAIQAVNAIAEGLKKAIVALIDFLAKTIDSVLGLIQDLYNAALTVIGVLIAGQFKELMQKVGQVIAAAKTAPNQFETAAYEELLGGGLDQPLSSAELTAAGLTPLPGLAKPGHGVDNAGPQEGAARAGGDPAGAAPADGDRAEADEPIPHPPWTEANVVVDAVAFGEPLEPELAQEVQARAGARDDTVEFGESDDQTRSLDDMLGRTSGANAAARATSNPHHAAHSPEAHGGDVAQQSGAQLGADGLTPRDRAAVKWHLMKNGLSDWWSKNWPYILAGGVLAVVGFIVANVLTGGAILAALPAIMTVVGQAMLGVGILQIVEHIRDFLQKAWNGDLRGGGKSLAKGLAAGAIELIMLLTFKVGEAAIRGASGVVRGARAAARGAARAGRAAVRGVERGAETLASSNVRVVAAIGRGVQYVIRAGKVVLRGVGQAATRGVKSLRELGARLLSRSRFKSFRIRVEGRRWLLEGRINPWVLLADGTVQWDKERGHGPMGSETTVGRKQGFVLGNAKADALADMLRSNPAMRDDVFAFLRRTDIDREGILRGLQKLTPDDAAVIVHQLRELKEVDETELEKMIATYRKNTGIPKGSTGGTVAAGKAETTPPVEGGTGASRNAQSGTPSHNMRYEHPSAGEDWATLLTNHAEQTVLGDIADKLDNVIKGVMTRDQVTGTIKMMVDQSVCAACRSGMNSGAAGVIKQFTTEFPNVMVMVSAGGTSELLVVKDGQVLIPR